MKTNSKVTTINNYLANIFPESDNYYGILKECPTNDRLISCPISSKCHLTFKNKIQWFDSLSEKDKSKIVKHHISCSKSRWFNKNRTSNSTIFWLNAI